MLMGQHFSKRLLAAFVISVTFVLTGAELALAQVEKPSSGVAAVVKGVVFDPTTYAPALIGYHATMKDWNTSQPFFQNGFVEHNPRFTVSGQPNDRAVSYIVGRNQIFKDAAAAFGVSVVENATSRAVEQVLLARYPNHRKAVKTVGWIQRIAVASVMSYHLSAAHYHQAQVNAQRGAELGLR